MTEHTSIVFNFCVQRNAETAGRISIAITRIAPTDWKAFTASRERIVIREKWTIFGWIPSVAARVESKELMTRIR